MILNEGFTKKYEDDTAIVEENLEYINKMIGSIKKGHYMEFTDNTMFYCDIGVNNKFYATTLFGIDKKPVPVLFTAGAADEKSAKIVWNSLELLRKEICQTKAPTVCPEPPFICDIVLPTAILRPDVMTWSAKFSVCFGFGMLRKLSDRK